MGRPRISLLVAAVALWVVADAAAQYAPDGNLPARADLVRAGRRLYLRRCVFCHGSSGRGDGPVARYVFPRPRDFTLGVFKIRSTPSGELPTDQDLFNTVSRGLPGTTMPAWANLSEQQRWALVAYIETFAAGFRADGRLVPIAIGTPKPPLPESVIAGRRLYIEAECWKCHGMLGKGDGPSAPTLEDDWGYPIVPADLRVSRNWRGGNRPVDIYRSIAVGIGGTPMPSWADALTSDQIWDMTNYLLSIIQQ